MQRNKWPCCVVVVLAVGPVSSRADAPRETVRYVRPAVNKFETECTFVLTRQETGWTITSTTERGAVKMEVETRYDAADRPTAARSVLTTDGKTQTATVQVKDGKATIRREGHEPAEFDAPQGTIVTSAPDWTDVFLLCRRYDRQRKGKQEFPALWIHPTQAPRRLTFAIEWQGTNPIEHDGKKTALDRFAIRIRNDSAYMAWTDAQGRMVRLIPLPYKESAPGLTLAGYEKSTAGLLPTP